MSKPEQPHERQDQDSREKTIADNVAFILGKDFQKASGGESVGGNAGRNQLAVNVLYDPETGKLLAAGNAQSIRDPALVIHRQGGYKIAPNIGCALIMVEMKISSGQGRSLKITEKLQSIVFSEDQPSSDVRNILESSLEAARKPFEERL